MNRFCLSLSCIIAVLAIQSAFAGQYFQNFNGSAVGATTFADGSTLFSSHLGSVAAVVDSTYTELQLTAVGSTDTRSAFILPVLDTNAPVTAFSAKWNSPVYGDFPSAANGFSFNFGQFSPDTNLISATYFQESGYSNGLCFSVQTYYGATPGFYIRINGANVASLPTANPAAFWGTNNPTRHFFEVDWNLMNGLTVRMDGQNLFTNVATTGFIPQLGDRFVWAARTGDSTEFVRLDNIAIITGANLKEIPVSAPYYQDSTGSQAFDGNPNTYWQSSTNTGYVGGTFAAPKSVQAYTITSHPLADRNDDPLAWSLQGKAETWTTTATAASGFLNAGETRAWLAPEAGAYDAWAVNVLAARGGPTAILKVAEIRFYEVVTGPATSPIEGNFGFFDSEYRVRGPGISFAVYPMGAATAVTFEWGTNTSYGNTYTTNVPAGLLPVTVRVPLGFPEGDKDYHCRITVQNTNGTVQTEDQVFHLPAFISVSGNALSAGEIWEPLNNAVIAADFDRDGKMDFLINGLRDSDPLTALQNTDNRALLNNFDGSAPTAKALRLVTALGVSSFGLVTPISRGATVIADFNSDQRLDVYQNGLDVSGNIVATGYDDEYLYLGDDQMLPAFGTPDAPLIHRLFPGRRLSFLGGNCTSASVTDFNGDGRTDILVCNTWPEGVNWINFTSFGTNGSVDAPRLSLNRAHAIPGGSVVNIMDFVPIKSHLPRTLLSWYFSQRSMEADYDNDGDIDVLSCPGGLYRNDGNAQFTLVNTALSDPLLSNAAWGDYDNDGDLDVVASYYADFPLVSPSRLFRNDGGNTFTDTGASFVTQGSQQPPVMEWVDMDHDGQLDLYYRRTRDILSSQLVNNNLVYYNDQGVFTGKALPSGDGMTSWSKEPVAFGDFNGDGRMDVAEIGGADTSMHDISGLPLLYFSFGLAGSSNQPPTVPSGLSSTTVPGEVTLNWGHATDDATPSSALTYNLRIGTAPGSDDTLSSLSQTNGLRLVSKPGNRWLAHTAKFRLAPGTYYWSVQAIDGSWKAGNFAPDQSFTITGQTPPFIYSPTVISTNATNASFSAQLWSSYENAVVTLDYGLTTNYGQSISQIFYTNEPIVQIISQTNFYHATTNIVAVHGFSTNLPLVSAWTNYHWRLTVSNSVGVVSMTELTMLPAPSLTVEGVSSNQLTLGWPETPGYQLEYTTNLNSAAWLTNGVAPNLTNGFNILAVPKDVPTKFFRLHKP
jgi:hypothetical protein